jgi:hypothetical protein
LAIASFKVFVAWIGGLIATVLGARALSAAKPSAATSAAAVAKPAGNTHAAASAPCPPPVAPDKNPRAHSANSDATCEYVVSALASCASKSCDTAYCTHTAGTGMSTMAARA